MAILEIKIGVKPKQALEYLEHAEKIIETYKGSDATEEYS